MAQVNISSCRVKSCLLIINKKTKQNIKPAGKVLPSKKVMGLVIFLDIPGTGGCRRRDSLMHIVVYGILLRSSLRTRMETWCQCPLSPFYDDIFKIKVYQSIVSLPSKTCIISSLHSFWCSGLQARLYRMKEIPLEVVSWPSNINVSTSARMSSSERPCWFSS